MQVIVNDIPQYQIISDQPSVSLSTVGAVIKANSYKEEFTRKSKGLGQITKVVSRAIHRASRNAACPCGSGKKYKKCHMVLDRK